MASLNQQMDVSAHQPIGGEARGQAAPKNTKSNTGTVVKAPLVRRMNRSPSLPIADIGALTHRNPKVRRTAAQRIGEILEVSGFLYLDNHGVDQDLIEKVYTHSKRFFTKDLDFKNRYYIGNSRNHRGYVPVTEKGEYDDEGPRLYEAFDMALDLPEDDADYLRGNPLLGPNVWPKLKGFRETLSEYYAEMRRIETLMCESLEVALGAPAGFIRQHMHRPVSQLRLIHYLEKLEEDPCVKMGAHTDYECFTILHSDNPGLQILDLNNNWIDAPPVEGAFYFNIGDILEVWSNGRFVATPHRVVNDIGERYSIPYFAATDFDTVIEPFVVPGNGIRSDKPRKYEPLVAGKHLLTQLLRDFPYLKKRHQQGLLDLSLASTGENPFEHRIRETALAH